MKKEVILSSVLTVFFLLSGFIYVYGVIPASERAALIALYNATNGESWADNSNWKGINNEPDGF